MMRRDPREEVLQALREIELERQTRETGEPASSFIRVTMTLHTEWFGQECIEAEHDTLLSTDCSNPDMLLVLMNRKVLDSAQMLLRESIKVLEERISDDPEGPEETDYPSHQY